MPVGKFRVGISTTFVFDDLDNTAETLNLAAELLWEWRETLCRELMTDFTGSETDVESDNAYEQGADRQQRIDVRFDSYRMLL